jgi:hypothetical protein
VNSPSIQICMPNRIDLNSRRGAFRRLLDFTAGAGIATLITCVLVLLLMETARREISSTVFRYVGF